LVYEPAARFPFLIHSHMLRRSCGYKLATRAQPGVSRPSLDRLNAALHYAVAASVPEIREGLNLMDNLDLDAVRPAIRDELTPIRDRLAFLEEKLALIPGLNSLHSSQLAQQVAMSDLLKLIWYAVAGLLRSRIHSVGV
jgi:hypothetical protein